MLVQWTTEICLFHIFFNFNFIYLLLFILFIYFLFFIFYFFNIFFGGHRYTIKFHFSSHISHPGIIHDQEPASYEVLLKDLSNTENPEEVLSFYFPFSSLVCHKPPSLCISRERQTNHLTHSSWLHRRKLLWSAGVGTITCTGKLSCWRIKQERKWSSN